MKFSMDNTFPLLLKGHENPLTYREADEVAKQALANPKSTTLERHQAWIIRKEISRARAGDDK